MPYTWDDYFHTYVRKHKKTILSNMSIGMEFLPVEEVAKALPLHVRLRGLTTEERLLDLPVEELLKKLPAEVRLKGLPVEERLKGLRAEEIESYLKKLRKRSRKK